MDAGKRQRFRGQYRLCAWRVRTDELSCISRSESLLHIFVRELAHKNSYGMAFCGSNARNKMVPLTSLHITWNNEMLFCIVLYNIGLCHSAASRKLLAAQQPWRVGKRFTLTCEAIKFSGSSCASPCEFDGWSVVAGGCTRRRGLPWHRNAGRSSTTTRASSFTVSSCSTASCVSSIFRSTPSSPPPYVSRLKLLHRWPH